MDRGRENQGRRAIRPKRTVDKDHRPPPFEFGETNPPPPELAAPVSARGAPRPDYGAGMTRINSRFGPNNCLFGQNNSVFASSRELRGTCWKCCAK